MGDDATPLFDADDEVDPFDDLPADEAAYTVTVVEDDQVQDAAPPAADRDVGQDVWNEGDDARDGGGQDEGGEDEEEDEDDRGRPVMAIERWRRRTAGGALATALALGLASVFQPPQDPRPPIVQETPGEPYDDRDPVIVDFEPDAPEGTTVLLRPWNFRDGHP